jgi:predicted lipoprotein
VKAPSRGWIVTVLAAAAWLAIARPWTIRPIAEDTHGPFDAQAYVARIWDSRALPTLRSAAVPFAAYRTLQTARATPVRLEGVVVGVDTASRVGTASIDVLPTDGRPDVLLMIGPVLRGTALRDALEFIQFTDFTNQLQFAAVGTALNERVLATALKGVTADVLTGHHVDVLGVAWKDAQAGDRLPFVVPVELSIAERP